MSTLSDPPSESFQLSKLVNDTRYRSYTFQLIALIALILVFAYLGSNLASNLSAAGLNISFGFLDEAAGYDINQALIDYDNQMTHWRATLVGALNTLLVAFLGCVLATIVGVIVGVLRLSKNWLIGRIMSIYVEIFRNVPVLIWILIIYFVMTAAMPSARDYLGEEPERDLLLGMIAFTNRGVYVPAAIFQPMGWVVLGIFVASIFGAIAYRRYATKLLYDTGRLLPMGWPMLAIVILPALIAFFVLGQPITLDRPDPLANRFNLQGGIPISGAFIALWFALSIYTAAFIAENVRAGILAVSRGQTEAAASLGLRPNRIMNLVILPQALRVIIPPVISQYLNLTKNSSLAIAVGYMDLTGTLGGITLNQTGRAIECILLLMLFYLAISLSISAVMNAYNSAIKLKER